MLEAENAYLFPRGVRETRKEEQREGVNLIPMSVEQRDM